MTPARRRAAVTWLRERDAFSERRACRLVGIGRASARYQATGADDAAVCARPVHRAALAIEVDVSLSGAHVVAVLERLATVRDLPAEFVLDHGPELTGRALDA